jgi:hypothetical protein
MVGEECALIAQYGRLHDEISYAARRRYLTQGSKFLPRFPKASGNGTDWAAVRMGRSSNSRVQTSAL